MICIDIPIQATWPGGTQGSAPKGAFLTSPHYPPLDLSGTDALQISWKFYFSNLSRMSANRTPRARAILAQFTSFGSLLWLSMKLIAGRLKPVIWERVSCEMACSLRMRASSSTTFKTRLSEARSFIGAMIADLCRAGNVSIFTYRREENEVSYEIR